MSNIDTIGERGGMTYRYYLISYWIFMVAAIPGCFRGVAFIYSLHGISFLDMQIMNNNNWLSTDVKGYSAVANFAGPTQAIPGKG